MTWPAWGKGRKAPGGQRSLCRCVTLSGPGTKSPRQDCLTLGLDLSPDSDVATSLLFKNIGQAWAGGRAVRGTQTRGRGLSASGELECWLQRQHTPVTKAPMMQKGGPRPSDTASLQLSGGRWPIGWGDRDMPSRVGFGSGPLFLRRISTLAPVALALQHVMSRCLCFLVSPTWEGKDRLPHSHQGLEVSVGRLCPARPTVSKSLS